MKNKELEALRIQLGMTIKELSEAIDVDRVAYERWENALYPVPNCIIRSIGALMWMGKADRESWFKYIQDEKTHRLRNENSNTICTSQC